MADAHASGDERTVYLDGEMRPRGAARISIEDDGLSYGLGFFETFRTSGGRPHLWEQHRGRLLRACAVANIVVPARFLAMDESRLLEIVGRQLEAGGLADGVFRYTVTAGRPVAGDARVSYEQPTEWLTVRPLPPPAPPEGVTLRVLALRRDSGEWLPRPKSLNFSNALLGGHELQRRGHGRDEGLFLSRAGNHVVETVRQNVAWVSDGRLCFPDPALGAVAGTCVEWLLAFGVPAAPCVAGIDDLVRAEAVVLLNSVRGVTPVRALWDAEDRSILGIWKSDAHPLVISVVGRWNEALRATAANRTP